KVLKLLLHLTVQISFSQPPMAFDGGWGDPQNVGRLFNRQTAKVSQFHHASLLLIEYSESLQGIIERNQFAATLDGSIYVFIQGELLEILTALFCVVLA